MERLSKRSGDQRSVGVAPSRNVGCAAEVCGEADQRRICDGCGKRKVRLYLFSKLKFIEFCLFRFTGIQPESEGEKKEKKTGKGPSIMKILTKKFGWSALVAGALEFINVLLIFVEPITVG
jgi:hypothetical protein